MSANPDAHANSQVRFGHTAEMRPARLPKTERVRESEVKNLAKSLGGLARPHEAYRLPAYALIALKLRFLGKEMHEIHDLSSTKLRCH